MTQRPPYSVDGSLSDEDNVLPIAPQDHGRTADALRLMDQIIQRSPIGVAVIDHEGVFRSVNPSYCLIYGYRQDELLGRSFTMLFPPPERERVMTLHRDYLDRRGELGGEWEVLRRDGAALNVISRSVTVPGGEGRLHRLVYVVDITDRRRMELELQASQRFTRSVLDGLSAHVCVIDATGVIVTVNRAWLDFAAGNGGSLGDLQEGANYLSVCEFAASMSTPDAAEAGQFLVLLREVLAGHRTHFQLEYPCHSPSEQRWFMVRVSRMEASDPPRYVVAHDDVTALKLAQQALSMLATTDELTGVANRRSFMQALGVEFERLRRHPSLHCSVLALDLDHFKHVNDTWGHAAGDAVLKHVARVVSGHTRVGDVVGRTGGEEFAMLLPDTALDEAETLSERLRLQVSLEPLQFDGHSIGVTVSIGIALLTGSDTEAVEALVRADRALYEAKDAGRNAVRRWSTGADRRQMVVRHGVGDVQRHDDTP
jgi:diguanylate cyclase (GGDEF)-like protein/PAS domain S-box-containing protein